MTIETSLTRPNASQTPFAPRPGIPRSDAQSAIEYLQSSEGFLIAANNLSDVSDAATALANLGGIPSAGIGSTVEAWSAELDAIAAVSGTGLLVRTAAATYAERSITGPAAGISVSNGSGVSGNPTIALANDLAALEGLSGTGIPSRTAADTWAQRTITGTTNQITATNGDGVSGNPTISIPSSPILPGTPTVQTPSAITANDSSIAVASAVKTYVDGLVTGLKQKPTSRLATTAALATNVYANGTSGVGATLTASANGTLSIDGVATALNDIILVKNEVAGANNGLYTVTTLGTASVKYVLTRHIDMDQAAEFPGGFIAVDQEGTANANSLWLCASTAITVGTTAVVFTQLNKGTDLSAGTGITISGNAVSITTNGVTNALLAQMGANTFKGNNTGSTANALDLTVTQATAALNAMVGDSGSGGTKGLVSAPGAGDAAAGKFWKADATWAVPAGGGGGSPVGTVAPMAGNVLPATGVLKCNGATPSRVTFANLFAFLVKSSTVTITIATPGVVTWTAHGLSANDPVKFKTTGALPTGITAGTTYFVVGSSITSNTFRISTTSGGTALNTTGSQSGTQTAINAPWGDGDGSTTFTLPDLRGEFIRGWDDSRAVDTNRSFGSFQADDLKSHTHTVANVLLSTGGSSGFSSPCGTSGGVGATTAATGGTETKPRNIAMMYVITY